MFGKTHRQKKCDGDFSINDAGIGLKLYLKKILHHKSCPVNFVKALRTAVL